MSPPSAFPSHETSDSLFHPDSPSLSGPVNAQETTRNRIIREIVETERKYVQDLEHMQVRSQIIRVALALAYVFARNMQMLLLQAALSTKTLSIFSSQDSANY